MVDHFLRNPCLVGACYCYWVADGNSIGLGERCLQERVDVDVHFMREDLKIPAPVRELGYAWIWVREFEINVERQYFFFESFI